MSSITYKSDISFWQLFSRTLRYEPGEALRALYWHGRRKRVRARNILLRASRNLPFAYDIWMARNEHFAELRREAPTLVEQWNFKPRFGILLHGGSESMGAAEATSRSVERQIYPHWSTFDTKGPAGWREAAAADCDYIVPLRIGDRLSEAALFQIAEALQVRTGQVVYGDEDRVSEDGTRTRPWFKPRWNRELFLAQDYLHSAAAIDVPLVRKIQAKGEISSVAQLLMAAVAETLDSAILHVPHILCHVGTTPEHHFMERRQPLERHLATLAAKYSIGPHNTHRVSWPLPSTLPLVSIVIPTKDKVSLLQPCVKSVLERTDYPNIELIIVDNLSVEPATRKYLAELERDPRVRIFDYPKQYNFSAINNYAASQAKGTFLCLLNNDTEVVEPAWLTEMMRQAVRPEVGAVGAKLLYEDGSIQHAGVVVGIGGAAGHAHRFEPNDGPGYFAMPHVAHFVSAVTAACLVVEKSKFESVGGLDEAAFAVAFNDVDFCLRLEKSGWKNVYVPEAVLLHHESKSRGSDLAASQIERYRKELSILQDRWRTADYDDPLHNPNLDRASEQYVIRL